MSRVLKIGILITLAAVAGFYVPRVMQNPSLAKFEFPLPDPDPQYVTPQPRVKSMRAMRLPKGMYMKTLLVTTTGGGKSGLGRPHARSLATR